MSIVLSILQVIGVVLLVILALLLLAVLVVLFCPVRYLIEGEFLDEKWAKAKAHWLLHLFRAKVSYGDDLIYGEVGVLWKKITFSFDLTKKEDEFETDVDDDLEDLDTDIENSMNDAVQPEEKAEKVIGTETAAELRGETSESEETPEQKETSEDEEAIEQEDFEAEEVFTEEQKESIVSKIKGIIERIKSVYPKIKKIVTDERNQEAVKHLKDEVIYLIKILLPKKSKIDAVFSTGSPDTTGQLFGILACFPAMYHKDWKLLPDFEADEAYFKGSFWGKGRVYGYQIVGIILRILFDKKCMRLYTMIKKFLKSLKRESVQEDK